MNSSFVRSSAIAYAGLLLVGLTIALLQNRLGEIFSFPGWYLFSAHLLLGGMIAALVVASSWALRRTFPWARRLESEFRSLLAPLSTSDAVALAIASGFVEEFFFRAILQPIFGLWLTSVVFGLLHYPMNRRMIAWPLLAALLGLMLGLVYLKTASLLAVVVAHGLANFIELMSISRSRLQAPG